MFKTFNRWRSKRRLKLILTCVLLFSVVFIFYQLLYYLKLTSYSSEESRDKLQYLIKSDSVLSSIKSVDSVGVIDSARGSKFDSKPLVISSQSVVVGAPPEYKVFYSRSYANKKYFSCFATGKKIAWDKVNDDFCDCPFDGSDEPSTAACMNGRFYCSKSKKGSTGDVIPSSRVGDGICDCCDGSDEFKTVSVISCHNRCD